MSKICKVWLSILLAVSIYSVLGNVRLVLNYGLGGISYLLSSAAYVLSALLMLFYRDQRGLYLYLALAVISFVVNLLSGVGIVTSIASVAIGPAITYYVTRNQLN